MESKRHLKRLISAAAAAIMTVSSLLPMSGGTLRASAAASSFTAEQGVAWAKARAAEHWNEDVDGVAGVTGKDAAAIQLLDAGVVDSLPLS